jgi:uncharacterized protein
MIFETIIITQDSTGTPHAAPFGIKYKQDKVIISPYKPSITLDNILVTKMATMNITDDVRVFAGALTNHANSDVINLTPLQANTHAGYRLAHALSHSELSLIEVKDDESRPQLIMQKLHSETHAPFLGFNRAQAAVVELCILVSRLHMLPREKIEAELSYLQIAIDKTAGEREREAWAWLQEKVEQFYAEQLRQNQA